MKSSIKTDEELRNLFFFLSSSTKTNGENVSKESLIYGLENFGLPIPSEKIVSMKNQISKINMEAFISYEEFKQMWTTNIDFAIDSKAFALQAFNMTKEILGKQAEKFVVNGKLLKEGVLELIKIFEKKETPVDDTALPDYNRVMNEMVEAIDVDGDGEISILDFEFLVEKFIEAKNNDKLKI